MVRSLTLHMNIITHTLSLLVMTTSTPEKQEGLKALQQALETVESTIAELGGVFKVQMAVSYFFTTLCNYLY